jgi:hypothetical protein
MDSASAKKKRGRPLEPNARRSSVSMRVTERVHDDIIRRAAASDIKPSEWMRRVVFSVLYKDQSNRSVPH